MSSEHEAENKRQIDALAQLMEEFQLAEATLETVDLKVAFRRRSVRQATSNVELTSVEEYDDASPSQAQVPVAVEAPTGTPITSPMNGIFYNASSPSSPPFVKEGDSVTAGQIVGLIEAMKVFNEIPSPVSGTVKKLVAESGSVVQPGEVLLLLI